MASDGAFVPLLQAAINEITSVMSKIHNILIFIFVTGYGSPCRIVDNQYLHT